MDKLLKRKIMQYIEKRDPNHEIVEINENEKTIIYSDKILCHNPVKYENEGYIRAYLIVKLITEMEYPIECIELEKHYNIGSKPEDKNAFIDIIVRDRRQLEEVFLFIECKAPEAYESNKTKIETQLFNMAAIQRQEGKVSYLVYYSLEENRLHEKLYLIDYEETPSYSNWIAAKPMDNAFKIPINYAITQHSYYANVVKETKNLKPLDMEFEKSDFDKLQNRLHNVLWGGGSTSYNDIFFYLMHIFLAKIYDEIWCLEGKEYEFQFRYEYDDRNNKIVLEKPKETFARIEKIYKNAQTLLLNMPEEIIEKSTFIDLDKVEMSKIMSVVHMLEGISITKNKNQSDILGDFFETIIENEFKQTKGQFFTPKNIVRFMVEALDVKEVSLERIKSQNRTDALLPYIIDPSCGSGTFLLESMKTISDYYIENKDKIRVASPIKSVLKNQLFIEDENDENQINTWAKRFIYGIESNVELTTATKVNMILHGDGNANIFNKSGLHDFGVYHDPARIMQDFENKLELQKKIRFCNQDYFVNEQFDFIITNPPFSLTFGDGEDENDYKKRFIYSDKKNSENLFIERWYQLLKEGGRVAAVLPDSVFDTSENKYIRLFLMKYFRINAVVSVDKIAFQPYTSTKVSILFATKRTEEQVKAFEKEWEKQTKKYNELKNSEIVKYICENDEIRTQLIKLFDKYEYNFNYDNCLLVNYHCLDDELALLKQSIVPAADRGTLELIEKEKGKYEQILEVQNYIVISSIMAKSRTKEQKAQLKLLKENEDIKQYVQICKEESLLKKKIIQNKELKLIEQVEKFVSQKKDIIISENDIHIIKEFLREYFPESKIAKEELLERVYDDVLEVATLDYPNWEMSKAEKFATGYCNSWWVLGRTLCIFDEEIFMAEAENVGYKRTKTSNEIRENDLFQEDAKGKIVIDSENPKKIIDYIKKERIWE